MCCILGFIKWSIGCVQRTLTFFLTLWLVLMVVYVCALAIIAGVAYGYDYCLAEFSTLSRSNVQLEVKPRHYGPDLLISRTGNIVDLIAEGNEYRVRPRIDKVKSAKKRLPQWLFKAHGGNTTSTKKKEMARKVTKTDELPATAMKFRKVEPVLLPFMHARRFQKTEADEDVTESHKKEAGLKLTPYKYAKWFSKPHQSTRTAEKVDIGEEETEINEKKADFKFPPLIAQPSSQLANHRVSLIPTHTTKEAEDEKECEEYQDGTNMVAISDSSTLTLTASPNPDITTTLSTNRPTRSFEMRWFIPKFTREAWRPATSDTFFYKTNKDDLGKTTKMNPYYPEMKIRVFDRPNYGKSVELPAMRLWDTITRTSESTTSEDNIDYKKFIYF